MIKRLLLIASAAVLSIVQASAQTAQTQTPMTVSELRQTLIDLGSYLDAHKGTNYAAQFSALTDEQLGQLLPSFTDPQKLKSAVAALKASEAAGATTDLGGLGKGTPVPNARTPKANALPKAPAATTNAVAGTCGTDVIIDNSPGAACTPAYPDPTNSAWQALVNPLITFGAFSPTDYPSVSTQQCSLTVESNLEQVTVALQGAVATATPICSAIPAPFSAACWAPVAVVTAADAVSAGLFADCSEQDGNVNSAEIDAAFHNTVTIYDDLNAINNSITNEFNNVATQITGLGTQTQASFSALDQHLTNVDVHVQSEFAALSTQLATLIGNLSTQLAQSTALTNADLRQVMKLEMTPDGLKVLNPAILTCTGTNCPNVLAHCPAAGCSWNNVGPLP